jgi:flagellar biosynthesis GTPase FlhF
MLGRQVTAALRRPLQARLRSIAAPPTQSSLCIRTFSYAPRLLTPAGRPKKAVGEPSRPVKRAVKAKAKEPASTKTDAAAKKIAEKEKAAKKKAAEKEKKKKAAAAKKEKPALTPEQVERKTAALQKAEIKDLKKAALEPPAKNGVRNAWLAFMKEKGNELRERIASESESDGARTAEGRTSHETIRAQLAAHSKNIAAAWKDVTPAEREVCISPEWQAGRVNC